MSRSELFFMWHRARLAHACCAGLVGLMLAWFAVSKTDLYKRAVMPQCQH